MKHLPLIVFAMLAAAIPLTAWAQEADEEENELNVTAERMEVQIDGKTIELTNNVRFEDDSMILTADRMLIFLEDEDKTEKKDEKKDEDKTEKKDERVDEPKTEVKDEKKVEDKTEKKDERVNEPKTEVKDEKKVEDKTEKKDEPKTEAKDDKKAEKKDDGMGNMKLKRIEAIGKVEVRSKGDATQSAAGNTAVYDVKTDSVTLSGECVITQGERTMKGNEVVFDRTQNKIFVKNADIRIRLKRGKDKGLGSLLGGKKDDKDSSKQDGKKEKQEEKKEEEKN